MADDMVGAQEAVELTAEPVEVTAQNGAPQGEGYEAATEPPSFEPPSLPATPAPGVSFEQVLMQLYGESLKGGPDRSQWPVPTPEDLKNISPNLWGQVAPIDILRLDPNNANIHPDVSIESIMSSLAAFGQRKPIVANANQGNVLEAGEGTLTAAKKLGWKFIAVNFENDDAVTHTGFAIADNRTAELSQRDQAKLLRLLESVAQSGKIQLEDMGYNAATMQFMKDAIATEDYSGEDDDDVDKNPPEDFEEYGKSDSYDYRCPKCGFQWEGKAK